MTIPKPQGIQIEVLDLEPKGHYVVLGTAGSGKTTLAIYRALGLSELEPDKNILLITFNTTLVSYLHTITGNALPANVHVRNYHKFARGYLASKGKMPRRNGIVSGMEDGDNKKLVFVKCAVESVKKRYNHNSTLKRNPTVFLEEIGWIEKMGIVSLSEYEKIERIGRLNTRITRENRKYFYEVYEEYLRIRKEEGYLYDWEDLAMHVCNELAKDSMERMYKHVIIDEGQDLSPTMLKSLVMAIPTDGSLTFFGDVAQQIYGSRISWRDAGLRVDKSRIWKFNRNYRNSKEIAALAKAISNSEYFTDEIDLVEPIMPTASSPLPAILCFQNEQNEINWIVTASLSFANSQSVAILVRNREIVDEISELIKGRGIAPQILKNGMSRMNVQAGLSIGTYHSAKGLEFDTVFLPYCSKTRLPGEDKIEALESREEALKEDIKLIYVGVTRAKRGLIISYSGEKTELLPSENGGLFDERIME